MLDQFQRDVVSNGSDSSFHQYLRRRLTDATPEKDVPDPAVLFDTAWTNLLQRHGEENLRFPHEIIWLGGAPGAGKGRTRNRETKRIELI